MAIRSVLGHDPEIEIVGTAVDGEDGVACAARLKPDVITMDVEMPRLDGISAVRKIMATCPTRIIMVSTLTCEGATASFDAMEAGAVDYVPKNTRDTAGSQEQFRRELLQKVKATANSRIMRRPVLAPSPTGAPVQTPAPARKVTAPHRPARRVDFVAIGASTGGPVAVQQVLSELPATFPKPVMVVIHMPKAFTGPYAERLNSKCRLQVKEAADGDLLQPGKIFIAPGGEHTTLVRESRGIVVRTTPTSDHPRHVYVPSVDIMLSSIADAANGSVLGVVLTGMGNDGMKGMQHLKSRGGASIIQDETTCTVFGMPRACIEAGTADVVLPLGEIGQAIGRCGTE
jgi:two-component system chemotaxis response regulator CheB